LPSPVKNCLANYQPVRYDIEGVFHNASDWHVTATAHDLVLGQSFRAKEVDLTLSNSGITANGDITGLLGLADVQFHGVVDWAGHFSLQGSAGMTFDAGITTIHGDANFTFSNLSGHAEVDAKLDGSFSFGKGDFHVDGELHGNLE